MVKRPDKKTSQSRKGLIGSDEGEIGEGVNHEKERLTDMSFFSKSLDNKIRGIRNKYEYKIVKSGLGSNKKLEKKLNELGEEGWEVVSHSIQNIISHDRVLVILKRQKK